MGWAASGAVVDVQRVAITDAAAEVVRHLVARHGPVLFHQAGAGCDGTAPTCHPRTARRVGARDVYLGDVAGQPFYMAAAQFTYRAHTHLTVDVVPGRGSWSSLDAPDGVRFLIRSRLFSDEEATALRAAGPPPTGDDRPAVGAPAAGT